MYLPNQSLDEAVELHEVFNSLFDASGARHFGWIVPFSVLVAALGITYRDLLRDLSARTRRRFILAAMLYVGGESASRYDWNTGRISVEARI